MASNPHAQAFESVLEEFKKGLKKRDQETFEFTTFNDLTNSIVDLQTKQYELRELQNQNRLRPFLEVIEQYGKLVEVFYNGNAIMAFVWGPIKFLLQVTSTYNAAFNELLDTYEHIGEKLPLLLRYQDLFRSKPHMVRILALIYEDILKFHRITLRYFQQPLWRQLFDATWKTYKARFSGIISNMAQHQSLIESQASLSKIEDFEESRRITDYQFEAEMKNEDLRRLQAVYNWLSATNVETQQDYLSSTRADYPGTGRWLLDNVSFKEWFNPQFPKVPPLLWLNGIPGAGKTILASLVVEEARKLTPTPIVLFFYCRHSSQRDSFLALARSLLAQLLRQDKGLLLYFYQMYCNSGEVVLTSQALVKELLLLAFRSCKYAYIILDGLDECAREERKIITQWFRKFVEDLPTSEPKGLRCLFISQDDGVARKDFSGLASIKIRTEDIKHDIDEYSRVEADKLKAKFQLSDEDASTIASTVANSAGGMFLLAKMIWVNLFCQNSLSELAEELEPNIFPKGINEVYKRIMYRINQQASRTVTKDALMLLGWLVCAKRPLKWYEIQGLKSINLNKQSVEFERQRFVVAPKDLCGSLVEIRLDGTLELVHLSAKFFLVDEGYVDLVAEEIKLASLCINYLNFPAFVDPPTEDGVLNGDYGFMDYAVLCWILHLEAGIVQANDHEQLMKQLAESLEMFINLHWSSPSATSEVSKRNRERLQFFKALPFYDKLEQIVISTEKQLKFFKIRKEEIALNLIDIVGDVRKVLERIASSPMEASVQQGIEQKYGSNLFKCPMFSCKFFTTGFSSAEERDKHVGKHDRPFRCKDETCEGFIFGFTSTVERDKHIKETHSTAAIQDQECPTGQDDALTQTQSGEYVQSRPHTDEGYVSATNRTSERARHSVDLEMDDTRTVYSDTLSFPALKIQRYISELADDLFRKLRSEQLDIHTVEKITRILPELLRAFALKVGHNAPSQLHRDIMIFVHRYRSEIVGLINDRYSGEKEVLSDAHSLDLEKDFPEESLSNKHDHEHDKMPLEDLMSNWYQTLEDPEAGRFPEPNFNETSVDDLGNQDSTEEVAEEEIENAGDVGDEEIKMPELSAYRDFILTAPAYEWLLSRLRREFLLAPAEPNHMEAIRREIIKSLPSSHKLSRQKSAEAYKMTFVIEWDPIAFIKEQLYKEEPDEAVEIAITLTGSAREAQALTCVQYMCQVWPLVGEHTIRLVKDAVRSGPGQRYTRKLPDDTKLTAWIQESKYLVEVIGIGDSIAEIGEQLAWLGAALRSSPEELGVAYYTPFISDISVDTAPHQVSGTSSYPGLFCKIDFQLQGKGEYLEPSNGQCWHGIFKNPVVVKGYPIRQRSEPNTGLEIPLHIMAGLARTQRINSFNKMLCIKGFSTMLVPVKHNRDLLIWHLLYNRDGDRISYLENAIPYMENISIFDLKTARHILGWCSAVKYYAGAADAAYTIDRSRLPRPYGGCVLEEISVSGGRVITGSFMFAIGDKDTPFHVLRNGYVFKLKWISKKFVVLWDQEDKRGWLINGTSALLHLLRASLEYDRNSNFKDVFLFKQEEMKEASEPHQAHSAIKVLLNSMNKNLKIYPDKAGYIRLEDRVEHFFDILEKIIDYQVSIAGPSGVKMKSMPRSLLEGWDFKDLATDQDPIYPCVAILNVMGKSWVDFTRAIHAITLFGRGFGEIMQPADTSVCTHWAKLPKDGYYLAIGISDLKEIMDMYGDQYTNPMRLNHNLIWYNQDGILECQCRSRTEHSELIQVLLPSNLCNHLSTKSPVQLDDRGAVIFGHNMNFKWFWKDTGDPEERDPLSPSEDSESQFQDSGIGRNSVSQQPSSETENLTPECYTVGVVCALHKELLAVRALFDSRHESVVIAPQDTNHYALGRIMQHNVVAACLPCGEYGTNSAADVASNIRRSFPAVRFCLLVGIGGGVPSKQNDIRLGDVVVSLPTDTHTGVIQYDLGKALENGVFKRTGSLQRPPRFLLTAISSLMSDPDPSLTTTLQDYIKDIQAITSKYGHPGMKYDKLFAPEYVHDSTHDTCERCIGSQIERDPRPGNHPNVHYGLVASGNQVMKDAQIRDCMSKEYNILCFEMEAAGVVNVIPCLVIRGICDYADSHKNKLWQEYAAATAAAYSKLLLSVVRTSNDFESMTAGSETLKGFQLGKRAASSQLEMSSPKTPRR